MAIMPSDHVVSNEPLLSTQSKERRGGGSRKARAFGIVPTGRTPDTATSGSGAKIDGKTALSSSTNFSRSPNHETAEAYVAAGHISGTAASSCCTRAAFLSRSSTWRLEVLEAARGSLEKATEDLGFLRLDPAAFANAPNISVDYAVIEKTKRRPCCR